MMTKTKKNREREALHNRVCFVLLICILYMIYRLVISIFEWLRYGVIESLSLLDIEIIKPSTTWVGLGKICDILWSVDVIVFVVLLAAWTVNKLLTINMLNEEDRNIASRGKSS